MHKHFKDYYWRNGKPYGLEGVNPSQTHASYKIVTDPYYKRISIEKYCFSRFEQIIYDSVLLDFRHLSQKDQLAWQREVLHEKGEHSLCLLRNQEDRAILQESLFFEKGLCRSCQTSSIHGVLLAMHRMFYTCMEDNFNGVILYDSHEHPVMSKKYAVDPITYEFTELLSEEWNMQKEDICQNLPS